MIEIGRESVWSLATRRVSGAFSGMSILLVLVWLLRGILGIQSLSFTLLLAAFGLSVTGRILRTETRSGLGRAVASFLWNIVGALVGIIISIWILGWVAGLQRDTLPVVFGDQIPNLVIIAVAAGLGAFAIQQTGLTTRWNPTPFMIPEGRGPTMRETKLVVKKDTVGMPIRREGRTIGCVLLGEVSSSFKTPIGMVSATLPGPVTTVGIPFQGRPLSKDDVLRLTGKSTGELSEDSIKRAEDVDVGRIRLNDGCMGDRWKVGPLVFDWDNNDGERHRRERWLAKGVGTDYVTTNGQKSTAKWNGSQLSIGDGAMELSVGSDSFSYSPTEVKTTSPLHTLQVTHDKVTLDTKKFTLKVFGDNVILRTEEKTNRTNSKALANDLRALLTETAKKQIKDVMEGGPIDLEEMFATTEEALAKYD